MSDLNLNHQTEVLQIDKTDTIKDGLLKINNNFEILNSNKQSNFVDIVEMSAYAFQEIVNNNLDIYLIFRKSTGEYAKILYSKVRIP